MYVVNYYKKEREKPIIKEPVYSNNNKTNSLLKRKYFYKKDLIDKCWNIKSLTIDIEDIKHIIYDGNAKHLLSLYLRVKRANFDEDVKSITILNNNSVNLLYIYEIINCKWMVNYNEELNNLNLLNTVKRLLILIDQYEIVTDIKMKEKIKNEIKLIKYYIDTILNKENNKTEFRTLKLGKSFIKEHN